MYQRHKAGLTYEEIGARDGWCCYLCDAHVERADAEVDHVIARKVGGPDLPWNVRLAHRVCNRRKQAKSIEDLDWVAPSAREVAVQVRQLLGAAA